MHVVMSVYLSFWRIF